MALCVAVLKKDAEKVRRKLLAAGAFDHSHIPTRDSKLVYFPVSKRVKGLRHVQYKLKSKTLKPQSLRGALEGKLTEKQLSSLTRAFDVIGDIAIIEIMPELAKKSAAIGKALLLVHSNLRSVYAKAGKMKGEYRVRKLKHIAGAKRTITIHKESGCEFKLDIAKAYFSPRLMNERKRIASLVKPREKILAFFAGVGPFPIVMAKRQPAVQIKAIELNPSAAKYLAENVRQNLMGGIIEPIKGDVHKIVRKRFRGWADRIPMTYPKGAYKFLDDAFYAAKPGCRRSGHSRKPKGWCARQLQRQSAKSSSSTGT